MPVVTDIYAMKNQKELRFRGSFFMSLKGIMYIPTFRIV
jgi:hypothetical protein